MSLQPPTMPNTMGTAARLGEIGIVPVVVLDQVEQAESLAQALLSGGLPCAEITFRTEAAEGAIRAMAACCPEMLVGAGTVLSVDQAIRALDAGARFIITPGFDPQVVDWCLERQVPILPGVMTPTEIIMALNKGLTLLKFFPAETAGGVRALRDIAGPFRGVKFIPTGGINPSNLANYLSQPLVHACGGSWMVSSDLINSGKFDRITQLAAEAVAIVKQVRKDASG